MSIQLCMYIHICTDKYMHNLCVYIYIYRHTSICIRTYFCIVYSEVRVCMFLFHWHRLGEDADPQEDQPPPEFASYFSQ